MRVQLLKVLEGRAAADRMEEGVHVTPLLLQVVLRMLLPNTRGMQAGDKEG